MTRILVDILLAAIVLATWLGCLGFARLRDPLDRLHCATFVNVASGLPLLALTFAADGVSTRALKTVAILAFVLASGAATSHAAGRALLIRSPR